jgi:hypothetical protein
MKINLEALFGKAVKRPRPFCYQQGGDCSKFPAHSADIEIRGVGAPSLDFTICNVYWRTVGTLGWQAAFTIVRRFDED